MIMTLDTAFLPFSGNTPPAVVIPGHKRNRPPVLNLSAGFEEAMSAVIHELAGFVGENESFDRFDPEQVSTANDASGDLRAFPYADTVRDYVLESQVIADLDELDRYAEEQGIPRVAPDVRRACLRISHELIRLTRDDSAVQIAIFEEEKSGASLIVDVVPNKRRATVKLFGDGRRQIELILVSAGPTVQRKTLAIDELDIEELSFWLIGPF